MRRKVIWQIWEGESEGATFPTSHTKEQREALSRDVDGNKMQLVHSFVWYGDLKNHEDVQRAFAYSKKFQYDEGEWPKDCYPIVKLKKGGK